MQQGMSGTSATKKNWWSPILFTNQSVVFTEKNRSYLRCLRHEDAYISIVKEQQNEPNTPMMTLFHLVLSVARWRSFLLWKWLPMVRTQVPSRGRFVQLFRRICLLMANLKPDWVHSMSFILINSVKAYLSILRLPLVYIILNSTL